MGQSGTKVREGFRRLALVLGCIVGVPLVLFGAASVINSLFVDIHSEDKLLGVILLVGGFILGLMVWGIVRLIGWVVVGFTDGSQK